MASAITRKRPRPAAKTRLKRARRAEHYLVDARGKRLAIVLPLEEYQRLLTNERKPSRMNTAERAHLLQLALQAKGSWKTSEGAGTAVEIVRRLRDEWSR